MTGASTISQDKGLVKRGLFLLGLMTLLVVFLFTVLFQRAAQTSPAATPRPELLTTSLVLSSTGFPAAVDWVDIFRISEAYPSAPGWKIRYNAAITLARRGSAHVPWSIIGEMLDEPRQLQNFREQLADGRSLPDEGAARMTMIAALRALADWHKKQEDKTKETSPDLAKVYMAVDKLAASPIMEVKGQAENTRKLFFR
jgi:hypothetical protein